MSDPTDQELIARCRQGDASGWDALFNRYYSPVARFLLQSASDFTAEDVEEVCQETFLTAIQRLESFRGQSQLRTWLFRIAANKAGDFRDRRLAAKRGGGQAALPLDLEPAGDSAPVDPPSNEPPPDVRLIRSELAALVGQSLARLRRDCRELIDLRYFGDLSYEEIARELDLNPKTVSSRLSRCLDRLEILIRKELAREKSGPFPV